MVLVHVSGVALDPSRQYVILLKPADQAPGEGSILPIWIGEQEATAILVAVEGAAVPRPLAHDLMRELAIMVAKDGEGLSKFVTIEVQGAESDRA
ncbi:MAG: bifunctional nuclease family protein, partial [Microbacterium sp.]|nr:bifunctional nuclease family protein [Microbacterium sp.]